MGKHQIICQSIILLIHLSSPMPYQASPPTSSLRSSASAKKTKFGKSRILPTKFVSIYSSYSSTGLHGCWLAETSAGLVGCEEQRLPELCDGYIRREMSNYSYCSAGTPSRWAWSFCSWAWGEGADDEPLQ